MTKVHTYSHPEIEFRVAETYHELVKPNHTTQLDLLEVYPDSISYKSDLDHSRLLHHFQKSDVLNDTAPLLRILFIEDLNFIDSVRLANDPELEYTTTAYWLQQRFGVSPLFWHYISLVTYVVKCGNANLLRRKNGKPVSVDGLYRASSGIGSRPCHLWFSHSLGGDRSSIYMIHQCPEKAKRIILAFAEKRNIPSLLKPLAIDVFLAEESLNEWGKDVYPPRNQLVTYERDKFSSYNPSQVANAVETLHSLSQLLHIIKEDLTDLFERLEYLKKVYRRLIDLSSPYRDAEDINSIADSFEYLVSKTATLRRWVTNYNERVGIRINLFFNISSQTDSRINLDIARLTSKIAVSTQKDSSSMITMAAVTMFFLPGTFVSALFSMVFFDTQNNRLKVGSQWWLFPAITIPLTILVFATWSLWQRYRNNKDLQSLGLNRVEGLIDVPEKAPPYTNDQFDVLNQSD